MNLVIVGTGFSKAVFDDVPLNDELLPCLAERCGIPAFRELTERYPNMGIEAALTKLDIDMIAAPNLRTLRTNIETELAGFFADVSVRDISSVMGWMGPILSLLFRRGDKAISLNYDGILEKALDHLGLWSPNGGYGSLTDTTAGIDNLPKSRIAVLKVHGSENFAAVPEACGSSIVRPVFDEARFPRSCANLLWGVASGEAHPYVIAPSYVKIPALEMSYFMIDGLKAAAKARNLIVLGCGLRPEDSYLTLLITHFFRRRGWVDRRIVIVDPGASKIATRLRLYWGVDMQDCIVPIECSFRDCFDPLRLALASERR